MTFPRFNSMIEHWTEHPPLNLLVEAFVLGVGGRNKKGQYEPPTPRALEDIPEFTAAQFNELSSIMGGCEMRSRPQPIGVSQEF